MCEDAEGRTRPTRYWTFNSHAEQDWIPRAERKHICLSVYTELASLFGQDPTASKEKGWKHRNQEKINGAKKERISAPHCGEENNNNMTEWLHGLPGI